MHYCMQTQGGATRYPQETGENNKNKTENTFGLNFMEGIEEDDRQDEEKKIRMMMTHLLPPLKVVRAQKKSQVAMQQHYNLQF